MLGLCHDDLLDDLGDDAGADGAAAFADREALTSCPSRSA